MTNKRGRKSFPDDMKANTTSVRLTTSQREMFKQVGGNRWLKNILEIHIMARDNKYIENDIYEPIED